MYATNQQCIIEIQQCSVMKKQSSITFQQCVSIKQACIGMNELHLLSTKYFKNSTVSWVQNKQSSSIQQSSKRINNR